MPERENLERLGGQMIKEGSQEMSRDQRIELIKKRIEQRNTEEQKFLALIAEQKNGDMDASLHAWAKLRIISGNVDELINRTYQENL